MSSTTEVIRYATASLVGPLIKSGRKGVIYVLRNEDYVPINFYGRVLSAPQHVEMPYPKSRPQFIEDCLKEQGCLGLVAASEDVLNELKARFNLNPIVEGLKVVHKGKTLGRYDVYR